VSNIVAVQYGTYSIVVCHCNLHQFFVHNVNLLGTQCVLKLLAEVKHRIQCYRCVINCINIFLSLTFLLDLGLELHTIKIESNKWI
jgi:hypothetical protein